MKCRWSKCGGLVVFDWKPRRGLEKLNKRVEHFKECYSHEFPLKNKKKSARNYFVLVYTPRRVVRVVLNDSCKEPNISTLKISQLVNAEEIYRRQPPVSHSHSVRVDILKLMEACRSVAMASLEGYAE